MRLGGGHRACRERSMRTATATRGLPPAPAEPAARARAPAAPPAASPAARLDAVAHEALHCRNCPLWQGATQTVWGEGPARARLMLVGEQPGDREDLEGRPFVGPAGRLLDQALQHLGWPRDEIYVTNAVKHFKYVLRGKRRMHKTPAQREAEACLPWLENELAIVQPKAVIALGGTAARSLLGRAVPVLANRGQWLPRPDGLPVLVTLHPSALLRLRGGDRDAAFFQWIADLRVAETKVRVGVG
jgi:uracil-DNA glycosylase